MGFSGSGTGSPRNAWLSLAAALSVAAAGIIPGPAFGPTPPQPDVVTTGFPSLDPDDGKFLAIAGVDFSTLAGLSIILYIGLPAGQSSFTVGLFDGDVDAHWDSNVGGNPVTEYRLHKDPLKNGATNLKDSWDSTTMNDDGWSFRGYTTGGDPTAPSGNYFYRLEIDWAGPSLPSRAFNNFKVRATGQVSLKANQAFGFAGGPQDTTAGGDPWVGSGDPNPGAINDAGANSYDGAWTYYFYVPQSLSTIIFTDGDADRADDTDDFNTLNVSRGTSPEERPEGINLGKPEDGPSGNGPCCNVPPNIYYVVTDPAGHTYTNTNPSGNQEWEDFIVGGAIPDVPVSWPLEAGLWQFRILGMDAHNFNALNTPYEIFTTSDPPLPVNPPPTLEPNHDVAADPGMTLTFPHTLQNNGGDDSFALTYDSTKGWMTRLYHDVDGDGVLDAGEPQVSSTGTVAAGGSYHLIVAVDVPPGSGGETDVVTIVAASENEWALQDDATDRIIVNQNLPPIADAGTGYTNVEGGTVTLDASGSSDPESAPLSYRWDFTNDGTFDTGWLSSPTLGHVYGDDFNGFVRVQVSDGELTDDALATVSIANVAPLVSWTAVPSGDEGGTFTYTVHVTDPGSEDVTLAFAWDDGTSTMLQFPRNPLNPDGPDSVEVDPVDLTASADHTYGDNAVFSLLVTATDDDGGSASAGATSTIGNLPPSVGFAKPIPFPLSEGLPFTVSLDVRDEGSDDLNLDVSWGDGTSDTATLYNNGVSPDPPQSPAGIFPFEFLVDAAHVYGDNGLYHFQFTAADDDGGVSTLSTTLTVFNVAPQITYFEWTPSGDEPMTFQGYAEVRDPGSDDTTYTWDLGYFGASSATVFNNGVSPDPPQSPAGVFPFLTAGGVAQDYGDNGVFLVTLTVTDDDGGSSSITQTFEVRNAAPTIPEFDAFINAVLRCRVAGSKWSNVHCRVGVGYDAATDTFASLVGAAEIERWPGNPDDNPAAGTATAFLEVSATNPPLLTAVVTYDPLPDSGDAVEGDQPNNGNDRDNNAGNPVWVIIETPEGVPLLEFHHTFNTQQSEIRDSEHWNHVDPWVFDFTIVPTVGMVLTFRATGDDVGSDDLRFDWDLGDGTTASTTYYNNGVSPDPFPSPEVNPISATDEVTHAYAAAGSYTFTLFVMDDDGGSVGATKTLTIAPAGDTAPP